MEKKRRDFIAFIPVRGGSKSIPKKNIKLMAGRPLVYWVLDAAVNCKLINKVYVSTDDKEIRDIIVAYGKEKVEVVSRSKQTATDEATTESAMLEFAESHDFENIILIQATSPLLKESDLTQGIERFINSKADSLLSTVNQKRFYWKECKSGYVEPLNYNYYKRPRRQDFDGCFVENGAFYICRKNDLIKYKSRLSGKIITYEMPEETLVEIDEMEDWNIVEELLLKNMESSIEHKRLLISEKLKKIKLLLTDVDGVLTDSGMYYSENGDELKKFNTRDGKGVEILKGIGIMSGIITGENTQLVRKRSQKLKMDFLFLGINNKSNTLKELLETTGLSKEEVAYIGDDINDLEVLKNVGFSAAPKNAMSEIRGIVDYVCTQSGGEGCFREIVELINAIKEFSNQN